MFDVGGDDFVSLSIITLTLIYSDRHDQALASNFLSLVINVS